MSSKGIGWAIEQKARGIDKLVLILLAEAHKVESGLAFPSIKWLVEHTGLDRKTVIRSLDRLEIVGLIEDTGERVGKTNQVKCYRLQLGTVPKAEPLVGKGAGFPEKGSVFGTRNQGEEPTTPISLSTPTSENTHERSANDKPIGGSRLKILEPPECVTKETWAAWIQMRRTIKKPATELAQTLMANKLAKLETQGWIAEKLLERTIFHSWQDVYPPKPNDNDYAECRRKKPIRIDRWD